MPAATRKNPGRENPGHKSSTRFAIDLRIADAAWRQAVPGVAVLVRRACRAALAMELGNGESGLALLLTNDAEMRQLNGDWRGKQKPTNVLSFPAEAAVDPAAPPDYLGDIALGLEICAAEAAEQGKSLADHVAHLVVHGTLHLLGYDHETNEQAAAMEPREVEILAGLGIADPYRTMAAKPKTKTKKIVATKSKSEPKPKATTTARPRAGRRA